MKQFSELNKIIPYTDAVCGTFYDSMLNNSRLAVFFESEAEILQEQGVFR